MPRLALGLVAVLLASCGGGGGGAGEVGSSSNPLVVPTDVVVADVDGDGRADVLTIALYQTSNPFHQVGHLSVYRQTSPGMFAAPDVYTFEGYPGRLHVVDVDGDGLLDILIADGEQLLWMKQDPSQRGKFESPVSLVSGIGIEDFAVGDLNRDGIPDIVIGECDGQSRVLVLYQNPNARGTFQPPVAVSTPGPVCAVAVADVDGDGRDDLAVWFVTSALTTTSVGSGALGIAWQAPDGTIGPVATLATRTGVNLTRLTVADYVGNGAPAVIAYVTPQASGYSAEVLVALHDPGSRSFTGVAGSELKEFAALSDAAFGDLDGDGRVDAEVVQWTLTNYTLQTISYGKRLRQMGDGSLQIIATDNLPIAADRVAVADLDGDGRNDIIVYGGTDQVVWLRQSHTSPGQFEAAVSLR